MPRRQFRHPFVYLGLTVLLIGLTLRSPILSVASLLSDIRADLGLSKGTAGLLTTIPVLCFGLVSPAAPLFARRFGMERVLAGVLLALVTGMLIRVTPGVVPLFGGTVLVGGAIAIGNVLLPGFVKREAPNHVGPFTSVYSAAISGGGALGAGLTLPIMDAFDLSWRRALAWPTFLSLAAMLVMIPGLMQERNAPRLRNLVRGGPRLWRNRLAWAVSAYMGMQSLLFFSLAAWLPSYLISEGMDAHAAGAALAMNPLFGMVGSFVAPLLVNRRANQRWLIWLSSALCATGVTGLIVHPLGITLLWMLVFGLGSGMTLSLALSFIGLRSSSAEIAADLSSMSQAVGYSVAATGPFVIGFVADLAGNWHVPMLTILSIVVPLTLSGLASARDETIARIQPNG